MTQGQPALCNQQFEPPAQEVFAGVLEATAILSAQFGFDSLGTHTAHAAQHSHPASQERKLGWDEKPLEAPSLPCSVADS